MTAVAADPVSAFSTQLTANIDAEVEAVAPGVLAANPTILAAVGTALDAEVPGAVSAEITAQNIPGLVGTQVATQVDPKVTAAQNAQAAAEAARDLALAGQFAGAAIGTADLNTLTTPGVYRQSTGGNATLAKNYPIINLRGLLTVKALSSTELVQEYVTQANGGNSTRGVYLRVLSGTVWTVWRFVPSQRVDQTAGRAIYTWDDVNNREQLIYGDTGIRDITSLALNGWSPSLIYLFRTGPIVTIACNVLNPTAQTSPAFVDIPLGFRPASGMLTRGILHTVDATTSVFRTVLMSNQLRVDGNLPTVPLYGSVSWRTNEAWPTTLPGTPIGSIPNV